MNWRELLTFRLPGRWFWTPWSDKWWPIGLVCLLRGRHSTYHYWYDGPWCTLCYGEHDGPYVGKGDGKP